MGYQGELIISCDESVTRAGLKKCVHCGFPFVAQPGSGNIRGYCPKCDGPVCGPKCAECVPEEQLLENIEKGRPRNFKPIIVPAGFVS